MDAIVIVPPEAKSFGEYSSWECLGAGYVASYLRRKGLESEVVNCNHNEAPSLDEVTSRVVDLAPAVLGLSVPTLMNLPGAIYIVQRAREAGFAGHVTFGGHVPTFRYRETLDALPGLDSIARGEAEETFHELVQACANGRDWSGVRGLAYRDGNGKVVCTGQRPLVGDLDGLAFPDRPLATTRGKRATGIAEMVTSRGCYGKCTFCSMTTFYDLSEGPVYRARSPLDVVGELEQLAGIGVRMVNILDDTFIGPGQKGRSRVEEIASLLIERDLDISFTIICRANDVDPEIFALLKRAGLCGVTIGLESCLEPVLRRLGKQLRFEQTLLAIERLEELGIDWEITSMIYDPDTTFDELERNVALLREHGLFRCKQQAAVLLSGMVVFPGTPIERRLESEDRLVVDRERVLKFVQLSDLITEEEALVDFICRIYHTYELEDPRANLARHMIDIAFFQLSSVHGRIWHLANEWRVWLEKAQAQTGRDANEIIAAVGEPAKAREAARLWTETLGAVAMDLLEDIVRLVAEGQQVSELIPVLQNRLVSFIGAAYPAGLDQALEDTRRFVNQERIVLMLSGSADGNDGNGKGTTVEIVASEPTIAS